MNTPEFSRIIDFRHMPDKPFTLVADEAERKALAARFLLVSVDRLEAAITLTAEGPIVQARGTLEADIVQSCAVSAEDLPARIREPIALRFVPPAGGHKPDEEIELDESDCDEIEYAGGSFDLGEAVAQGLALAIDPFATGPNAEKARKEAGLLDETASGPFAALAGLKKQD